MGQAQGALRDPKQIFFTKNLKLVKKKSAPRKSTAHMKKHKNHKNLIFNPFIHHFDAIVVTFYTILEFQCFGSSTRCCERSETNFLDKKSETCQQNPAPKNPLLIWRNMKIITISYLTIYPPLWCDCSDVLQYFWSFSVLGQAQGALRDPKQIFLDKKSETCQKKFSSKKIHCSYEET